MRNTQSSGILTFAHQMDCCLLLRISPGRKIVPELQRKRTSVTPSTKVSTAIQTGCKSCPFRGPGTQGPILFQTRSFQPLLIRSARGTTKKRERNWCTCTWQTLHFEIDINNSHSPRELERSQPKQILPLFSLTSYAYPKPKTCFPKSFRVKTERESEESGKSTVATKRLDSRR